MSAMCGAKARTIGHRPCRQPAMANGRCRFHGGKSTGPKTKEGVHRIIATNWKHGFYSKPAITERQELRVLIAKAKGGCN